MQWTDVGTPGFRLIDRSHEYLNSESVRTKPEVE